ncbi:hypothetical protein N7495_001652 [Penicillium taxi]|uniref:uncharacterized protein n=1 Tax=Penicillium taxi TaxID=168475 RepID=UPI002544F98C|nr:uncharacterized protein N7495_001652 [Penicillium taxi]KAJ5908970.1 hypothetical protein N7495_001652 [Penicillium taxi]
MKKVKRIAKRIENFASQAREHLINNDLDRVHATILKLSNAAAELKEKPKNLAVGELTMEDLRTKFSLSLKIGNELSRIVNIKMPDQIYSVLAEYKYVADDSPATEVLCGSKIDHVILMTLAQFKHAADALKVSASKIPRPRSGSIRRAPSDASYMSAKSLHLQYECHMQINHPVTERLEACTISGIVDYAVWYSREGEIGNPKDPTTNLVMVEAKYHETFSSGQSQCLGYMVMALHERIAQGLSTQIWSIVTDGRSWDFLILREDMTWMSRIFNWGLDIDNRQIVSHITHIFARASGRYNATGMNLGPTMLPTNEEDQDSQMTNAF